MSTALRQIELDLRVDVRDLLPKITAPTLVIGGLNDRLVDPRTIVLTGLTRDGLWWIEKGRISHPVRNLRFNQSVLAMLAPACSAASESPAPPSDVPAPQPARSRADAASWSS